MPLCFKKIASRSLVNLCFIVILFSLSACNKNKQPVLSTCLTAEERKDLEYFFRFLVFENYGAFVLFGSKPLCIMSLQDTDNPPTEADFQKWVDSMSEDDQKQFRIIKKKARERQRKTPKLKRNPYRGLLALEKVKKTFRINNYILRIVPAEAAPVSQRIPSYDVMLINIQQTALVLAENYEIFKNAAGMDFHPLQAVFELQNPDSVFWENVFSMKNHIAKGLLFGFGLKNSIFGNWSFSGSNGALALPSDEYRENIVDYLKNLPSNISRKNPDSPFCNEPLYDLAIPLFGMVPWDETAEKYTKEKAFIEKIYRGQDMVEVTLRCLAGL